MRFSHIPVVNGGTITLAYTLTPETKELRYGVAFCSPTDQFSRKLGCTIAKGRYAKKGRGIVLTGDDPVSDILMDIEEGTAGVKPYKHGETPGPQWFFGA